MYRGQDLSGFFLCLPEMLTKTESAAWTFVFQEIHVPENLLNIQLVRYSAMKIKFCFFDDHLTTGNQAVT